MSASPVRLQRRQMVLHSQHSAVDLKCLLSRRYLNGYMIPWKLLETYFQKRERKKMAGSFLHVCMEFWNRRQALLWVNMGAPQQLGGQVPGTPQTPT